MKKLTSFTLLLATLFMGGCATSVEIAEHSFSTEGIKIPALGQGQQEPTLDIQYLGVGGHRIQYGDAVLLTGPSFTNPSFLLTGPFMPLSSNHKKIDKFMPESSEAQIILVGHAHYDHLLDVRSEEHTSELQSRPHLVCRLLLE